MEGAVTNTHAQTHIYTQTAWEGGSWRKPEVSEENHQRLAL